MLGLLSSLIIIFIYFFCLFFRSAAMFAVAKGDLAILNVLIKEGINLNQNTHEGMTPLMAAAAQVL